MSLLQEAAAQIAAGVYNVDPAHSSAAFSVKHMGIATVRGQFAQFAGHVAVSPTGQLDASGQVEVASITTGVSDRDVHLRSEDFFDADHHPQITLKLDDGQTVTAQDAQLNATITIRGIAKPAVLDVSVEGSDTDPWGNDRVALSVQATIKRSDFGMTFNQALGSGQLLVSDKVKIQLDLSLVKA